MKSIKGTCSGPTFIKEGDVVAFLGDRQEVKDRLAAIAKADCRLESKKVEVSTTWDNANRKRVNPVEWTLLTFIRDDSLETGRADDHFAAVNKVIHDAVAAIPEGTPLSIVVKLPSGKDDYHPTRGYVQVAYEVCTLGKFRKSSPEVEDLISEGVAC